MQDVILLIILHNQEYVMLDFINDKFRKKKRDGKIKIITNVTKINWRLKKLIAVVYKI